MVFGFPWIGTVDLKFVTCVILSNSNAI